MSDHSLSHLNEAGDARMVEVGEKAITHREARAAARVTMKPETLQLLLNGKMPKGDVFAVVRVAGIMAAKIGRAHV